MAPSHGQYTNKIHYIKKKILEELTKKQYAQVFMRPMNERDPDYQLIKRHMDLGTIITRVQNRLYRNANEAIVDLRLVYQNWIALKTPNTALCRPGNQLQKFVENKLGQMPCGAEFELNKDPRMTVKSIQDFPWLQINSTEPMTHHPTFNPNKKETVNEKIVPARGKAVPVAVKREPVVVKREPVAVKTVPGRVKKEPVAVKIVPARGKAVPVAVKGEPVALKHVPMRIKIEPVDEVEYITEPIDNPMLPMEPVRASVITEPVHDHPMPVQAEPMEPNWMNVIEPVDDPIDLEAEPNEEDESLRTITKILGKEQLNYYLQAPEQPIDDADPDDTSTAQFEDNCKMWDRGVDDLTSYELQIVMHIVVQNNMPATIKNGKVEFNITKFSPQVISLIKEALFLSRRSQQFQLPQLMTADDQKLMTDSLQTQLGEITAKLSSKRTGAKRSHPINTENQQMEFSGPAALAKMACLSDDEEEREEEEPTKKKKKTHHHKHHKRSKKEREVKVESPVKISHKIFKINSNQD
ncbi:uncharacterized protein LOC111077528 [Drosophila obscura]|uniref:uncharacterized protein LOC111077528 n=1 Tax=Drosophila obscura TaxID=7282 RepID=UPI001BB25E6B|nr:uncharacterized protein LOC111077528 [Drosophila obscura]